MSNDKSAQHRELRIEYLEAMGIRPWEQRNVDAAVAGAVSESELQMPAAQPEGERPAVVSDAEMRELGWDALRARVAQCKMCELHLGRTHTVFGCGDQSADLLVIGEAPGQDEDLQGEPFVGRAGQLLNAMLKAIGLDRKQVYIANILKCRPPNNRDPRPGEISFCEQYLMRQIQLVQPVVLLAVGRIAAQNLLETEIPIGKLRGRPHRFRDTGIPLVATYHPAYLLRSPLEKRKAWQDLLLADRLLKEQHG